MELVRLEVCRLGSRWTSNAELMNLDTAITAMSALMIVMLVPSGRYLGLISYLLDLTSSQAVVMGWAPLVSASFLFIWACNWVGAIIPWSFIEIPSGELAAPTNDINVTTFLALCLWLRRVQGPLSWQVPEACGVPTSWKSSRNRCRYPSDCSGIYSPTN